MSSLHLVDPVAPLAAPLPSVHLGPETRSALDQLLQGARLNEPVLLVGETGTGKSTLARTAFQEAPLAGPLIEASLHTLPDSLLPSALLGSARGSYTGAVGETPGLLEQAEDGVLFIDEVDKLSPVGQRLLLGPLDGASYRRIGDRRLRPVRCSFVFATSRDLDALVRRGDLLPDLYYRLSVLRVYIPPLRQRRGEILPLAEGWLHRADPGARLARCAREALLAWRWPGNLRELKAAVIRGLVRATLDRAPAPQASVTVSARDLQLGQGPSLITPDTDGPVEALHRAADAWVQHALGSGDEGFRPLDHADAFKGAIVDAAIRALGGDREAALALGLEPRIPGGNHLKTLARARAHLSRLEAQLARTPPSEGPLDPE